MTQHAAIFGACLALGACTAVLGIDGEYHRADDVGGAAGTPSTGGDPTGGGAANGPGGNGAAPPTCEQMCDGECMSCEGAQTGMADDVCAPVMDGVDVNCNGPSKCYAGMCQLAPDGAACAADNECVNTCQNMDAVCCTTACTSQCESCLGAQTGMADGVCAPVMAGTDPEDECAAALNCDGNGACI